MRKMPAVSIDNVIGQLVRSRGTGRGWNMMMMAARVPNQPNA
jgi:hypothetical protein